MNNRKTSGYDEIKGMLKTLRSLNETVYTNKNLIKEEDETQQPNTNTQNTDNELNKKQYDNVEVVNDVDVKLLLLDDETMDMLEKLRKFEPTFTSAMEPLIRDRMNA